MLIQARVPKTAAPTKAAVIFSLWLLPDAGQCSTASDDAGADMSRLSVTAPSKGSGVTSGMWPAASG
jgi:hypothetical protein